MNAGRGIYGPDMSFADSWRKCPDCTAHHPAERTCLEHRGLTARVISDMHLTQWMSDTAARLAALVGDEHLYPLLTFCKIGYGARKLTQAVGKLLVKFVQSRVPVCDTKRGVRGISVLDSVTHHSLPRLHGLPTRYVTSALLLAFWWLQRRAWTRRAAAPVTRPSGTTRNTGGVSL